MTSIFWDSQCVIMVVYLEEGRTINGAYYAEELKRLHKENVGVVGWCESVVYLTLPGRLTDISLQLGKACYPCSR